MLLIDYLKLNNISQITVIEFNTKKKVKEITYNTQALPQRLQIKNILDLDTSQNVIYLN